MSVRPLQQGVFTCVPVKSIKMMRRRMVSSRVSKKRQVSRKPKNMYYHVRYTPMAELRCNYETLLSWLKLVVPKADSGEISENSVQDSPTLDLSIQQIAKYRVPLGFIDEMLDSHVISDRMSEGCQSSVKSVNLSDLHSTKYTECLRVSSMRCWTVLQSVTGHWKGANQL